MKKVLLTSCFLLTYIGIWAQRPNCVEIDFEQIPNLIPVEGSRITDQYQESLGVTFSSSPGFTPILAEVGAPSAGFGSQWGADIPRPGVDIGRFFLTDDGMLSGLIGQPLIITFERPIYFASGCILDIDLSEIFTITAHDENDVILFTQTIATGDAIAGDGEQSCWEFEYNICSGIRSIRIQGTRTQDGQFGFGYDNFQFCYVIPEPDIDIEPATCNENNAIVSILSNDETNTNLYTFNNVNFNSDTIFSQLSPGSYQLNVINTDGCSDSFPVIIDAIPISNIIDVTLTPSSCNMDNGTISVQSSGVNNTFSLNNMDFQTGSTFNNLANGLYLIHMLDENGCPDSIEAEIIAIPPPQIDTVIMKPDLCSDSVGSITIASSGSTNITYSIDGVTFVQDSIFANLSSGDYIAAIKDDNDCIISQNIELIGTPALLILDVASVDSDCEFNNGSISLTLENNEDITTVTLNNSVVQSNLDFTGLASGPYTIQITNQFQCEVGANVFIAQNICPVFVPNVFTPNGDGSNDHFTIYPHPRFRGQFISFHIFNRWGDHVYKAGAYEPKTDGWDGRYKGEDAPVGVYMFYFEATFPDGGTKLYKGDLTLLR